MFVSRPIHKPVDHQQAAQMHSGEANTYFDFQEDTVHSLVGHWVDRVYSSVQFQVKFTDGSIGWRPESVIHDKAPELVIEYWERNGDRERATGLTKYHVLKILGVCNSGPGRQREKRYLVQWVGYTDSKEDTTIERESKLRKIDRLRLQKFKASNSQNVGKVFRQSRRPYKRPKERGWARINEESPSPGQRIKGHPTEFNTKSNVVYL
ncbi:hypothetical protein FLAG1_11513 [Fusarium langsethiae]|uniref:Chromo domain-containing protein n=1 Tax=Fusarium langsethiae TaxID=179993 RepID=A0A0M9ELY7_FUSLA|nr:hypothetical protein FLAG1_11513 [Fusarium langsethiae]GKU10518.1 unnamed protein product [Fusarium langsethiae]